MNVEKNQLSAKFSMTYFFYFPFILLLCFGFLNLLQGQPVQRTIGSNLDGAAKVKVVDLDGDEDLDVVACAFRANVVNWYENDEGVWQEHLVKGNLDGIISIDVGDMDGDNDIDIVTAEYGLDAVRWYENPDWTMHVIDDNIDSPGDVQIIDINSDDTLDVVASSVYGNKVVWYEGPSWTPHVIDNNPSGTGNGGADELLVWDADNDGDLDVVASIWFAPWKYTNTALVMYEAPDWTKKTVDNSIGVSYGLAAGDIDGDDTTDVVATSFNNDFVVWYKLPGWKRQFIDNNLYAAMGVDVAYVNDDNILDVVACGQTYANPLRLYLGPNWAKINIEESSGSNFRNPVIVDLDNNDSLDVVASIMNKGKVVWYDLITNLNFDGLNPNIPLHYAIEQNYPNPFNPSTTITFSIPQGSFVTLKIYNLLGQEIAELVADRLIPGNYTYEWDASGLASGVYLYQLSTNQGFTQTRKLVLMK